MGFRNWKGTYLSWPKSSFGFSHKSLWTFGWPSITPLSSMYWVTRKAANIEWNPEQEKALWQVRTACRLPLDQQVQQIQWCFRCQWLIELQGTLYLGQTGLIGESQLRLLGFWSKIYPLPKAIVLWETAFDLLLGLTRDWTVNQGPPSYSMT